jgi:hypothetical protein
MSEETILKLVTIITPAIVAVIGLLVRAYLITLGKEVDQLRATIASLHAVVLKAQGKDERTYSDASSERDK